MTKALVFDLDGTLYRQFPVRCTMAWRMVRQYWPRPLAGWRTARALQGYRRAQEQLRGCRGEEGRPSRQLDEASRLTGQPPPVVLAAVEYWMEQAPLAVLCRHLRPGVRQVLLAARARGLRLAVLSDYPADAKLRAMRLRDAFDVIVTAQDDEVQRFKPHPRGLRVALDRLGVQPDEALYVGDRAEVDGVAAANAGVPCVILASGRRHRAQETGRVGAWRTTANVHDVMSMIVS